MKDDNFIASLNNSYIEIRNYIKCYINIFKQDLESLEIMQDLNQEQNVHNKLDCFANKVITCQYFFKQLHEKIQWPQERNYLRDQNNNYTS